MSKIGEFLSPLPLYLFSWLMGAERVSAGTKFLQYMYYYLRKGSGRRLTLLTEKNPLKRCISIKKNKSIFVEFYKFLIISLLERQRSLAKS
jgi:hypothetical protein